MSVRDATRVVIVGAGFAGIACAKHLAHAGGIQVTLIDRNRYHQFQPLLYQVATAELTPRDVGLDLARMFGRDSNVRFCPAEVVAGDPQARAVTLAGGDTIEGDVLVLAAGAQPNFFHVEGAAEFAYPLYSLDQAKRIREQVLGLFADTA